MKSILPFRLKQQKIDLNFTQPKRNKQWNSTTAQCVFTITSYHSLRSRAAIELIKVDLESKLTETGEDFRQLNPNGYVPLLILDDGNRLTEGPAIVQYLAISTR